MRYGLAILIIAFLAIVGTVVLIGRDQSGTSSKTPARLTKLIDYENSDSASISWTQQGRLVGDDQRHAIRITISRNARRVEILDNYAERTERSEDFGNSSEAFSAFVRALDAANFGRERTVKQADERGVCPTGNRFIYRATDKNKEVMRTWSDNCANTDGPFGGGNTTQLIGQLFKAQIAGYNKFVSGVQL